MKIYEIFASGRYEPVIHQLVLTWKCKTMRNIWGFSVFVVVFLCFFLV